MKAERARPPRIALFVPSLGPGGLTTALTHLAREWANRDYEIDIVVMNDRDELDTALPANVARTNIAATSLRNAPGRLTRYLDQRTPDLVIAAGWYAIVTALTVKRTLRRDMTVWVRQDNVHSEQFRMTHGKLRGILRLMIMLLPSADRIISVSNGSARDLEAFAPKTRGRVEVIPNGLSIPAIEAAAQVKRRPGNEPPPVRAPTILGLGRFVPQKDFGTLIDAFAILCARRPARLRILGTGTPSATEALRTLAKETRFENWITIEPWTANPYRDMSTAAAIANTSTTEGFGLTILESLAVGTPVVATDCPHGPGEVLDNGRYGRLIPVGNTAALADALGRTLDERPDREALRARAREFSIERYVDAHIALFKERRERRR